MDIVETLKSAVGRVTGAASGKPRSKAKRARPAKRRSAARKRAA